MSRSAVAFTPFTEATFEPPPLEGRCVHVWSLDLRTPEETLHYLASLLSSEERRRAERFHFDRHRRRFIVTQGSLRRVLASYSGTAAGSLAFELGPKGKPSLRQDPDLHFNLSHSSETALIALSRGGELGVDVERVRPLEDADDIARRFFSRREVAAYLELEPEARRRAFFDCWTRKEAFVKALGEGLFVSLDRFDVSLRPDEPARLLAIEGEAEPAEAWRFVELAPGEGYAATLAARWPPGRVRAWRLEPSLLAPARRG